MYITETFLYKALNLIFHVRKSPFLTGFSTIVYCSSFKVNKMVKIGSFFVSVIFKLLDLSQLINISWSDW